MYVCNDQQSGHWLIRATDNRSLGSGNRLKAADAKNLSKPVKVGLATKNKVAEVLMIC
jgi:hypothetical protein